MNLPDLTLRPPCHICGQRDDPAHPEPGGWEMRDCPRCDEPTCWECRHIDEGTCDNCQDHRAWMVEEIERPWTRRPRRSPASSGWSNGDLWVGYDFAAHALAPEDLGALLEAAPLHDVDELPRLILDARCGRLGGGR